MVPFACLFIFVIFCLYFLLGAGQDVGRSCILISIGSQNIMLDCGMHMGYPDQVNIYNFEYYNLKLSIWFYLQRRFPDFSYITHEENLNNYLDCVIISHFHLDHCGALPYMTEMVGYNGPIYMTHPTKAICPILLVTIFNVYVQVLLELCYFYRKIFVKLQ